MNTKELLKKIRTTRLVNEISQGHMARKLKISVPTYSRFERGITKTNVELLQNVSKILALDFFTDDVSDHHVDMVNENFTIYETKTTDIKKQIRLLIKLLEKQQELNTIVLEKLQKLKFS